MAAGRASPLPNCAFYNIHFLGLSAAEGSEEARDRKLKNVRALVQANEVVAISELHADGFKAEQFFFRHVKGVKYYEGGMMFLVNEEWAREQGVELSRGEENGRSFEVVIRE